MQIHPAIFEFLKAIREHNDRKYFASIRPLYDDILYNFTEFIEALGKEFESTDSDFSQLEAKKCLFRIYRDARRLKEGDYLYKYNFWALISPEGKKTIKAYPYLHLEPGGSFFAGGIFQADASELKKVRTHLAENGEQYYEIIEHKEFKKRFSAVRGLKTKTVPRGFSQDTPYIELIRKKKFIIYHRYKDKDVLWKNFFDNIVKDYILAKPFFDFLNESLLK